MASTQDIIDIKNRLIQSALELAASSFWADISMDDIIAHAQVDHDDARVLFADKIDILTAYGRQVDMQMVRNLYGTFGEVETTRDKIFDTIMERFDILNDNRDGVLSILNAVTIDPKQAMHSLPNICNTIEKIMNVSGVNSNGWKGCILNVALSGIYIKTLRTWAMDSSVDMATTMANLDKSLEHFETVCDKIGI